ncbi:MULTISPECIES: ABC transporter permease [Cycloclasticus]|uniref:Transport permease protein n=1 Tax=Cycloclasticus pugetii TaxID=34068 RepID=A0AB33Z127_9GAMM|nr:MULTISPECIES: ABC transporter permease [Cycloclasticus]EPD12913.1 ABC-2 type transport system integral membrane protein [Cycloclasticus pugetii]
MLTTAYNHKSLIFELLKRDFKSRYLDSIFGLAWAFITPLIMLAMYSLVFGFGLRGARNGMPIDNGEYVLMLFSGLIIYFATSECITKSVRVILKNQTLVKKVIFPVEILPVIICISSLLHLFISLNILLIAYAVLVAPPPIQTFYIPLLIAICFPMLLSLSWLIAALGTLSRDIEQITGLLARGILFISPVLYRFENPPYILDALITINPISLIVEQMRTIVFNHSAPDFSALAIYFVLSLISSCLAYLFFMSMRKHFADLI